MLNTGAARPPRQIGDKADIPVEPRPLFSGVPLEANKVQILLDSVLDQKVNRRTPFRRLNFKGALEFEDEHNGESFRASNSLPRSKPLLPHCCLAAMKRKRATLRPSFILAPQLPSPEASSESGQLFGLPPPH